MIRVLLSFEAWVSGLSGGDRHLLESAARWRDEVALEVVAPPQAVEAITAHLGDVPIHRVGVASGPLARNGPGLAVEYLRRSAVIAMHARRADVAIGASHFLPDATTVSVASHRGSVGVVFVYHLVAEREDRSLRTRWSQFDEAVALRLIRASRALVFSSNEATAVELRRRGFDPQRTNVGLDLASFRRADPADAPPVVLFLARLVPKKGLFDLIEAMPAILHRVPEARALIVGSGPSLGEAQRRSTALGIDHAVEWRGFVSEDEKRHILASARVFAAPSYEEGWGISVGEAMASGLPVVAYRLPTLDEIFGDGYIGVELGSTQQLAEAITGLLIDPSLASRTAANGLARAATYDVDVVAESELRTILARVPR